MTHPVYKVPTPNFLDTLNIDTSFRILNIYISYSNFINVSSVHLTTFCWRNLSWIWVVNCKFFFSYVPVVCSFRNHFVLLNIGSNKNLWIKGKSWSCSTLNIIALLITVELNPILSSKLLLLLNQSIFFKFGLAALFYNN